MIQRTFDLPPTHMFFIGLSNNFTMIAQKGREGYFHLRDEFFIQVEVIDWMPKLGMNLHNEAAFVRSVWIPPHNRRRGRFHEHMTVITELADLFGVALLSVANPFELTPKYDNQSIDEMREIFVNGIGFRERADFEGPKLRQRRRFRRLGFQNLLFGEITNRARINRNDYFVYLPESLSEEVRIQILHSRR